jgi:hypothetical protein
MLLSPEDAELFFKLHRSLMFYVNQRLGVVPDIASPEEFSSLPPETRHEVRAAFLDEEDLIESFVDDNPSTSSTLIADTQGSFFTFQSGSAINEAGVASFWAAQDVGGETGQLAGAGDGTTTTTIFTAEPGESIFLSPSAHSINATNTVPVVVKIVGGGGELRIGNGGPTTLVLAASAQ